MLSSYNKDALANILYSIDGAISEIETKYLSPDELQDVYALGYFKPDLEEKINSWLVEFVSVRESLWEVLSLVEKTANKSLHEIKTEDDYQYFFLAYVAACLIVRCDRLLLEDFATHKLVQRKLNEGILERNIPRKIYTKIYNSFIDVDNAFKMLTAMNFAKEHRENIFKYISTSSLKALAQHLPRYESYLDPSRRNYFRRLVAFVRHVFRRKAAVIKQNTEFGLLESSGRAVSEFVNKQNKNVTPEILASARNLLQAGDVIVTRHKYALSNVFLPGYWPHVAFYIGNQQQREQLGVQLPATTQNGIAIESIETFEALKDGVLFRKLESTLHVDAFVILRPKLKPEEIKRGIERVLEHEGKKYNFNFDFFRADRLVCTELIYRAYDGIANFVIPLKERAGRPTLSAEDLIELSLESSLFIPVALYDASQHNEVVNDLDYVHKLLKKSYRD